MDNYPDDIRDFDHDHRSPFYEEEVCPECSQPMSECLCNEDEEAVENN